MAQRRYEGGSPAKWKVREKETQAQHEHCRIGRKWAVTQCRWDVGPDIVHASRSRPQTRTHAGAYKHSSMAVACNSIPHRAAASGLRHAPASSCPYSLLRTVVAAGLQHLEPAVAQGTRAATAAAIAAQPHRRLQLLTSQPLGRPLAVPGSAAQRRLVQANGEQQAQRGICAKWGDLKTMAGAVGRPGTGSSACSSQRQQQHSLSAADHTALNRPQRRIS